MLILRQSLFFYKVSRKFKRASRCFGESLYIFCIKGSFSSLLSNVSSKKSESFIYNCSQSKEIKEMVGFFAPNSISLR